MKYNKNSRPLQKIVYGEVDFNGKTELIPMELHTDHSLEH